MPVQEVVLDRSISAAHNAAEPDDVVGGLPLRPASLAHVRAVLVLDEPGVEHGRDPRLRPVSWHRVETMETSTAETASVA